MRERVRAARVLRGWSQCEAARQSGVSRASYVRIEAGVPVAFGVVGRVLRALDLPVALVLGAPGISDDDIAVLRGLQPQRQREEDPRDE